MKFKATTLICLLAASGAATALADERGPTWFHVTLKDGTRMTLKLLREGKNGYDAVHEGFQILVERDSIKKVVSVAESGVIGGHAHSATVEQCESFLDQIEDLGSLDHAKRRRAINDLAGSFPEVRPFLHAALSHKVRRVRQLAAQILGEQREGDKDREAVFKLLDDPEERVRMHALFAIQKLGRGGVDRLLKHLQTESSVNNRKLVIKTLERWKVEEAVEPFVQALMSEKDRGVRFFLVNALEYLTGKNYGHDTARWLRHVGREGDVPVVPAGIGNTPTDRPTPRTERTRR